MNSISIKVTKNELQKINRYYQEYLVDPVPYSIFRAKVNNLTITGYQTGKILFQGPNAEYEAERWQTVPNNSHTSAKKSKLDNNSDSSLSNMTIIGSDEVGNGSYFGALTVCAVYLEPKDFPLAKELGVKDSKLLSDDQIRNIAWQLKAAFKYKLTVCPPDKYNQNIDRLNAVGMKVSLHNFTIQKLIAELSTSEKNKLEGVLIDQFTPQANYLKYLKIEKNPYNHNLIFKQKAESLHLSVACASIIARDAFLDSLETLGKPYNVILPSGAGVNVDKFGRKLVHQYGPSVLENTAKLHFKNTQKILK